jgi:hypothetical protein
MDVDRVGVFHKRIVVLIQKLDFRVDGVEFENLSTRY